ncbi:hypothetical protein JJC00_18725 [Bradyrhizobium diazoefficiens]|uniref:hypothetical protein n=1 Tax=Bradyrhizobium diazoefficiens TaxID=1355477 RepID=UPI00190DBE85|nr:hypothetical protein [Bradyrhizobium diazoefficiens]QQO37464.1 hypothetical protein JJC00_18725 [Bradyrhizobium diazoefficiens]
MADHIWHPHRCTCMACGLTVEGLLNKPDAKCSGRLQFREILDCRPSGPRWICEPIDVTRPVSSWGR